MFLLLCFGWKKISFKKMIMIVLVYGITLSLCSFVWYLRSYLYEGNPVYPFFPSIFGGTGHEYDLQKQGFGKGPLDLLLLWIRASLHPEKFGGTWAWLGLTIPFSIPVFLFHRWKNREQQFQFIFVLLFFFIWFYSVQNLRFLFPIIPIVSILIVIGVGRWRPVLILVLLAHTGFAFYRGRHEISHWLNHESSKQYLARVERTYPLSEWVNQNLPVSARIMNVGDMRMFYFDPEMIREKEYRQKTRYDIKVQQPEDVVKYLRGDGIDYVFYWSKNDNSFPSMSLPQLMREDNFRQRYLELMHEENSQGEMPYQIYKIRSADEISKN